MTHFSYKNIHYFSSHIGEAYIFPHYLYMENRYRLPLEGGTIAIFLFESYYRKHPIKYMQQIKMY